MVITEEGRKARERWEADWLKKKIQRHPKGWKWICNVQNCNYEARTKAELKDHKVQKHSI